MAARLKEMYVKDVAPALMKKFEYKSVMQIPKLEKIVINVGCGEARENSKALDAVVSDLKQITGQEGFKGINPDECVAGYRCKGHSQRRQNV